MEIATLRKFVPFNELDEQYLQDALDCLEEKRVNKGEMLFKRGRAVAQRYYLLAGSVDLIDADYQSTHIEANTGKAEYSLNSESPTRVSAIAKTPVSVFTIETELLDRIVSWSESAAYAQDHEEEMAHSGEIEVSSISDEDATDWMSSLLKSPLFVKVPLTQVQELFSRFESQKAKAGEVIIREGEKGDYFYVMASGKAYINNHSESVDVTIGAGDYFGEEALLGNTPRNATVTMTEAGYLKRLGAEDFESLLKAPILQYLEYEELENLGQPFKILDVKIPQEFRFYHVPDSINVPLARLRSSMSELATSKIYVVPDDAGSRADIAAHLLCQNGFEAYILKSESVVPK